MSRGWITLLGIAAAIGTTGAWLPQIVKTFRTRSARDFSWGYLGLFTAGVALWAIYGVLRNDVAIYGANFVTLGLVIGVTFVKVIEERRRR